MHDRRRRPLAAVARLDLARACGLHPEGQGRAGRSGQGLSDQLSDNPSGLGRTRADSSGQWSPGTRGNSGGHARVALPSGRRGQRQLRGRGGWSCQPRARTGRKPGTFTSTRTTTEPILTSTAAVEFRPGIDMVRRRSTVRFRNGAPAQRDFSNPYLSADFKIKRLTKRCGSL